MEFIPSEINVEDFQELMHKTRESTYSSPYGIHMGHYVACEMNSNLSKVCVNIINIPFNCGFSLKRWGSSVHQMIQKQAGNNYLHKLRIIQLVEEDYNTYQQINIGNKLMQHIEKR